MNRAKAILAVNKALNEHMQGTLVGTCCAQVAVDAMLAEMGDDTAEFHVRKDAPETSKAIVDKIRGGSLQDKMLFQYQASSKRYGGDGFTDDEMEQIMGRTHQSVSATRNTLMRKGYLVDSGVRRRTRSGNDAIVYVWTGKVPS